MHLCFITDSGTQDTQGNTSHYVLAGLSIPLNPDWKPSHLALQSLRERYNLLGNIPRAGWMMRRYSEQFKISRFELMSYPQRKSAVLSYRRMELHRLGEIGTHRQYRQTKKNYDRTYPYIHLTYDERKAFLREVANAVCMGADVRLFAECIDKKHLPIAFQSGPIGGMAFERIAAQYSEYIEQKSLLHRMYPSSAIGLVTHEDNQSAAKRYGTFITQYHAPGGRWVPYAKADIRNTELRAMYLLAVDLCAYALRRYVENGEEELFERIMPLAGREKDRIASINHHTSLVCSCRLCV